MYYDPYCLVKHGERSIFKTHTIFGTRDPIWEKGVEILIPSCRDVVLSFDIFHNSRGLGSHDLLGSTNLILNRVSVLSHFHLLLRYFTITIFKLVSIHYKSYYFNDRVRHS